MYQDFKHNPTSATYKFHKEELQQKANRGSIWIMIAGGVSLIFAVVNVLFFMPVLDGYGADPLSLVIQGVVTLIGLVYITLGILAHKGKRWAYITAMVLYCLDALLLLISFNLIAIGLRAVIIYFIGVGLKSRMELDKMIDKEKTADLEDHLLNTP